MKYCLSCRQPSSILRQVDEIKVQHRDCRIISDLLVEYPKAKIIWELPQDFGEYKKLILQYNEIADSYRLVCCLNDLSEVKWFKVNHVPFYYGFPIGSYYDLKGLDDLGVEYVKITAPLTHDIKRVGHFGCEIRAVPNVAYDAYIPRQSGLTGGWIRPEDVEIYGQGIDTFEFEGNLNLKQEQTLWEIYNNKGKWDGNLNILITNLDQEIMGASLPDDFGKCRSICRQICMSNGSCHYCDSALRLGKALEKKVERERKRNGGK